MALGMLLGILSETLSVTLSLTCILAALTGMLSVGFFAKKRAHASVLTFMLIFTAGGAAGILLYNRQMSAYNRISSYGQTPDRVVCIRSAVSDIRRGDYYCEFTVRCQSYALMRMKCDYELLDNISPREGEVYEVEAEYADFNTAANYGNFDEKAYYNSLGYAGNGVVKSIRKIRDANFIRTSLEDIRENIKSNISAIYPEDNAGLAASIIIGDRSGLDGETKELFGRTGMAHILAISSLHLTYVGMLLYGLLKRRLHYIPASVICMALMTLYAILTGPGVSAMRAVIMLCVRLLAGIAGRKYDASSALSLWVIVSLCVNPSYIHNSSFILSGSISFFIISVIPKIREILSVNNTLRRNKIANTFFDTAALYILTMPVTAAVFYRIPVYSVFLNMIVIPLLSFVLVSGIVGVILCEIYVPAGIFAAGIGSKILMFYRYICGAADNLPHGIMTVGKPGINKIIIFYAAVSLILLTAYIIAGYEKKRNRKFFSGIKRLVILSGCVILIQIINFEKRDGLFISFINVGQGDSIFIKSESGNTYLVDAGSSSIKNVGKTGIATHLYACAADTVDYVIVSHTDGDHVSGLLEFLNAPRLICVRNIILPDITEKNDNYTMLEKLAKENGINIFYMSRFDVIRDGELSLTCINPQKGASGDVNDMSVVLSVKYREFSMLLTGDITEKAEKEIIESGVFERGDFPASYTVLKVAHHGSKYSSSADFIEKVNPMYSVISYGKNSYGHPSDEVIERLVSQNSKVFLSSGGGIMMKSNGTYLNVFQPLP